VVRRCGTGARRHGAGRAYFSPEDGVAQAEYSRQRCARAERSISFLTFAELYIDWEQTLGKASDMGMTFNSEDPTSVHYRSEL
jgi:hypothetical protein